MEKQTKRCSHCDKLKPMDAFKPKRNQCRECRKKLDLEYWHNKKKLSTGCA